MPVAVSGRRSRVVGVDAAAAGAAIAAAITGTLHAAPFTTERRSKVAFGAARLLISDIFYPRFLCGGEPPVGQAPAERFGIR